MVNPEIRFQFGYLIDKAFSEFLGKIPDSSIIPMPPKPEVDEQMNSRVRVWKENENRIITFMQESLGLNFYQSLIDVYFVNNYKRAFSDPLIICLRFEGDRFVDILTHEIIHRLLTDNKEKKDGGAWPRINYPHITDRILLNHILVHALHKKIYLELLNSPERLKIDIDFCEKYPSYKGAWDIVEKEGYQNLINRFIDSE